MSDNTQTKPEIAVTPEEHVDAVKTLMSSCLRVRYNKAGLPKSKQASDGAVTAVAEAAGGADEDSFSVSKRLFKSGKDAHPLIGQINEWASKVDKWRNSFTFSMAADDSIDVGTLKKAKGERLIRAEDVDAFEEGLANLQDEGLALSRKLHEDYDAIMAMEKNRLKKEFKQEDYPSRDTIWQEVEEDGVKKELCALRIGNRQYTEVTATVRLPQRVLKQMAVQAAELMNSSVEVAVADLVSVMTETFTTLANQLVDRIRIRPRFGTEVYKAVGAEAEVLRVLRTKDDKEIPEGHVSVEVQWSVTEEPVAGGRRKTKKITQVFGPMTEADYEALRPEPMDATKKLTTSVVERFGTYLDTFSNLQQKLGAYGWHMDSALEVLRNLHHKALKGNKKEGAEGVIAAVKGSNSFRHELKEALEGVCGQLQGVAEEVKKVRRKVHGSIAASIAKANAARKADAPPQEEAA